jgi:large subunit ribosomal protein L22
MVHYEYGFNKKSQFSEKQLAKAQQYNIDASYKDLAAVCDNIRGLNADEGVKYLQAVLSGFPVEYRKWNKKLGHRRELGGKKGRYPIKAAGIVLSVLNNAIANATSKGLDNLVIVHAAANKQAIYPRLQSKGRQMRANYETARVEVILAGKENEALLAQQKKKIEERAKIKAEAKAKEEAKIKAETEAKEQEIAKVASEHGNEMQKNIEKVVEKKTEEVVKEVKEEKEKKQEKQKPAKKETEKQSQEKNVGREMQKQEKKEKENKNSKK